MQDKGYKSLDKPILKKILIRYSKCNSISPDKTKTTLSGGFCKLEKTLINYDELYCD